MSQLFGENDCEINAFWTPRTNRERAPIFERKYCAYSHKIQDDCLFNASDFAPGIYSVRVTDIAWVQAVTKLVRIAH